MNDEDEAPDHQFACGCYIEEGELHMCGAANHLFGRLLRTPLDSRARAAAGREFDDHFSSEDLELVKPSNIVLRMSSRGERLK